MKSLRRVPHSCGVESRPGLLEYRSVNRTERLLDLITYLLNSSEPVSWREIKNHFPDDYSRGVEESNQRKFERDKAELISLGIPIDYRSGAEVAKDGYIIREDKLFLREIKFNPAESSLLMLSANAVLENSNFPYQAQLKSALYKITSISQVMPPPTELNISFPNGGRTGKWPSVVHEIREALDRKKSIEIEYYAFSTRETTRRKVDPYGLIFRKGNWTLVGWDHLREGIRCFVLERMSEVTVNRRRPGSPDYTIPGGFSLKPYQNQQPWELAIDEPVRVSVEISEHRLPELLPQLTRALPTGERTFDIDVTNRSGFLSWILELKTDARVLAPEEIRNEIQRTLRNLL